GRAGSHRAARWRSGADCGSAEAPPRDGRRRGRGSRAPRLVFAPGRAALHRPPLSMQAHAPRLPFGPGSGPRVQGLLSQHRVGTRADL
ncbi:MAG: hypothetical protein AVDCRST_MAG77-3986, partial [uncultured Chloroflexi bacterium]